MRSHRDRGRPDLHGRESRPLRRRSLPDDDGRRARFGPAGRVRALPEERQRLRRNPLRIRYRVRLAVLRKPRRRLFSVSPRDPAGHLSGRESRAHPATRHLPPSWVRTDEHYSFRENPRGESPRVDLPRREELRRRERTPWAITRWSGIRSIDGGGRSFYTALGHTKESYSDPLFREHLASAISWAASVR